MSKLRAEFSSVPEMPNDIGSAGPGIAGFVHSAWLCAGHIRRGFAHRAGTVSAARMGMDAVSRFGSFMLDFKQMRVDGRLKSAAERKASQSHVLMAADVKLKPEEAAPPRK